MNENIKSCMLEIMKNYARDENRRVAMKTFFEYVHEEMTDRHKSLLDNQKKVSERQDLHPETKDQRLNGFASAIQSSGEEMRKLAALWKEITKDI